MAKQKENLKLQLIWSQKRLCRLFDQIQNERAVLGEIAKKLNWDVEENWPNLYEAENFANQYRDSGKSVYRVDKQ